MSEFRRQQDPRGGGRGPQYGGSRLGPGPGGTGGGAGVGSGPRPPGDDVPLPDRILVTEEVRALLRANPDWIRRTSPGLRYQRLLDLWERQAEAGALEYRRKRNDRSRVLGRFIRPTNRAQAGEWAALLDAIHSRQEFLRGLTRPERVLRFELRTESPFVTGLGKEHPLENGFAFLKPYGVPYLAGSGVKGALRSVCERIHGETEARTVFGTAGQNRDSEEDNQRGQVEVWDLFPVLPPRRNMFRADLNNPHYPDYYQGKEPPTEWQSPVPTYFMTLQSQLQWVLYVRIGDLVTEAEVATLTRVITECVREAGAWSGLGGKKSWGYGLFAVVEEEATPSGQGRGVTGSQAAETSAGAADGPSATGGSRGARGTPEQSPLELRVSRIRASEFGSLPGLIDDLRCQPPVEAARLRQLLLDRVGGFEKGDRGKWRKKIDEKWPPEGTPA